MEAISVLTFSQSGNKLIRVMMNAGDIERVKGNPWPTSHCLNVHF
jgi:hypothetical protein